MIRVLLPGHLKVLAKVSSEVALDLTGPVHVDAILDTLEHRYPMLRGTIRDHTTGKRRPMLRFFACKQDISNDPTDRPLPPAISSGTEPFIIIGAIAGG